jgi:hypothetical protein
MANTDEIRSIELRRLAELEKIRAYKGIDTEPAILIEISELRAKHGADAVAVSRSAGPDLGDRRPIKDLWDEVDFLRAICTSALREYASDRENRKMHQMLYTAWMVILTLFLFYALFGR